MKEKLALITGATSGIGKSFAKKFASLGYNLIIIGRREPLIKKVAKELEYTYSVKVCTIISNLSNTNEIDALVEKIKHNNIDVLINNAGFGTYDFFYNESLEKLLNMINLHVVCTTKLTYAILPGMLERNEGIIINVSSESAYLISPKSSVYSGTKAFVKLFTESLSLDLKNYNIKVQTLCPSFTKTDFHEKLGISKSEQINKGLIRWEEPEAVVEKSMKYLDKNRTVCLCGGIISKLLIELEHILPQKTYYNFVYKMFK
ncbi:hypothetical protein SAMN02745163_01083 [Clostridium cavendishii DSM 21758]|uniref:Short-chain dehydrogenase n=1 Tax=Clostridium cavendishii DSM 21758 TaxID=1121302 RepID=A0A1M6FAY3_9CLOT|nr:SDR family oxidoreductase [Clostridium cavendishii]SHI94832.1 hypothetical protein SAMN02745163_01083 [Clostridium cavendishii DSM 21758]